MADFNTLYRSGNLANIRILMRSKTKPQLGVGVKYSVQGTLVQRNIVPLVSESKKLTRDSKTKVFQKVADLPPDLYGLMAQAYEYTDRWSAGQVKDIRDFIGISSIGELDIYGEFD